MATGNGVDNAAFDGLIGNFARRPVTDGPTGLLGWFTRDGHDLAPLLGPDSRWGTGTRRVLQALKHRAVLALEPVGSPSSDSDTSGTQMGAIGAI